MIAAAIRKAVSQDRLRFNDGKHDLDLSYITPYIIAMAIPGSGIEVTNIGPNNQAYEKRRKQAIAFLICLMLLQTYWRNDIDTVASMLETYHKGKYMIWNLSELTYNYDKFDQMVWDSLEARQS
jgi:phosphatidylinositol-3,4,5-trisphosphate 3-phosphatase/dual-specificity protein phosphatase PTEN